MSTHGGDVGRGLARVGDEEWQRLIDEGLIKTPEEARAMADMMQQPAERVNYCRHLKVRMQTRAINLNGELSAKFTNEKAEAFLVQGLRELGLEVEVTDAD